MGKTVTTLFPFLFNSFSLWSKIPEMELPLQNSPMTLFFFELLMFRSEVGYILVPDADQVAQAPKVSHFDCSSMTQNSLYAINQVRPCHITPEELEVSKGTITLYTKHFRKKLNATKCRIQHQREKWHCGHNDHSSIDHTIAGIKSDFLSHQNIAELLQREPVSIYKATGLALSGTQRLLLSKFLVIHQAQIGIIAKREAGFLGILSLSTCKKQL